MFKKASLYFLLATCLLLITAPHLAQAQANKALPDNVPQLLKRANQSFIAKDYQEFRNAMVALNKMRPYNSDYMYQLVIANALLNDKSGAYDVMLSMQKQGLSYDFLGAETTANIRGTQVFDYLNELMVLAGDPMGDSETAFVLPENLTTPEAIEWDASREKFLLGTRAEGSIVAVGMDGQVEELIKADAENGLWAVMDILIDQASSRLWVTTAAVPEFAGFDKTDKGRSALYEYDLKTLELLNRHPVPVDGQAHVLGSMVLTPTGDIFIADRYLPLIYRKAKDEGKLNPVMLLKGMISLRGTALNESGSILYVADREMGIAVVDLKSGKFGKLVIPETLNLGGIDGLYSSKSGLVIVQNGISPQRVMLLQLDSTGLQVTGVVPMAVAQPEFDYPTYGVVHGEDFYFFANSHWVNEQKPFKAVTVLRAPLNSDKELVQPDMRRYLEKQAEEQKLKATEKEAEKN